MDTTTYFSDQDDGADAYLWRLFENDPPGFFVDVGAFDGVYRSASLSFERVGWSGICIEAHPTFARQCARNRGKSLCLHAACVADPQLDRTEFFIDPLGLFSHTGANCPDRTAVERRYAVRGMAFPGFAKVRVPARTLDRILGEFAPPETAIDFLSIDVNGSALEVLRGLDLTHLPARVLLIRAEHANAAEKIAKHLHGCGCVLALQLGPRMFFAKDANDAATLRKAGLDGRIAQPSHPSAPRTPRATSGAALENRKPANQPCENVLRQQPGQPLWELLKPRVEQFTTPEHTPPRDRFAHVVHTYACPAGSIGEATQRFTFAALERAKCAAHAAADVEFISVHLADDRDFPPPLFRSARELDRTVLDVHQFGVPRRLPLVFDILERGIEAARDADFIVFTNADICPMPHFYEFVSRLLSLGFDALLINRRVAGNFPLDDRWRALAEADYGGLHPGFDCFVFPVKIGPQLVRSDACVGAEYVMRGLLYNLVALCDDMLILTDVHATYHIGADSEAQRPELQDYTRFNQDQARAVLAQLCRNPDSYRRLRDFCVNHHEFAVPDAPVPASAPKKSESGA